MSDQHAQKHVFQMLDLLRGIAALAVVTRHLGLASTQWLPGSYLAVDLFFILSGFVIQHAYAARLDQSLTVARFMGLRVIRLYPLYLLGTVLGIAGYVGAYAGPNLPVGPLLWSIYFALMFLPVPKAFSVHEGMLYPLNHPAWSLCWELTINLVYAAIFRWLRPVVLTAVLVLGGVLLVIGALVYGSLDGGFDYGNAWLGAARVVFSFFAGVALNRIWACGRAPRLSLPIWMPVAILLAIFAVHPAHRAIFDAEVVLVVLPALVLVSANPVTPRMQGICALLGRISYPVYALHAPLALEMARRKIGLAEHLILVEVTFIVGVVILALLADRYVDSPVRKWLSGRLPVRRIVNNSGKPAQIPDLSGV